MAGQGGFIERYLRKYSFYPPPALSWPLARPSSPAPLPCSLRFPPLLLPAPLPTWELLEPIARTAASNDTCLLPEPSWSQAVLLFLCTRQASPALPSKERNRKEGKKNEQGKEHGSDGENRGAGGKRKRGRAEGGAGEIVPTTTGTPIPQPEARYHNQKLDPTTTEQLFTQKRSLVQLERVLCLV